MSASPILDWLSDSETEQDVLRSLVRHPRQTVPQLAQRVARPTAELEPLLARWTQEGRLVEQLTAGQRLFSVRLGRPQRAVRNMPAEIFRVFEQPPDTFLAETPLTAVLSPQQRETLLSLATTRKVVMDEVIQWQGKPPPFVALVRHGLFKRARLRAGHGGQRNDYGNRGAWFGLRSGLHKATSLETITAVTEGELLVWPRDAFVGFARSEAQFGLALSRYLSRHLYHCERSKGVAGKVWVIEGARAGAGVTTLAAQLANLVAHSGNGSAPRVLLWDVTAGGDIRRHFATAVAGRALPAQRTVTAVDDHLSLLVETPSSDYAPQVQLNIALSDVQSDYDFIICDTGAGIDDEFVNRLRAQAHTLITLCDAPDGGAQAQARWTALKPYARPGQKRLLALNKSRATAVDPRFHLVLPPLGKGRGPDPAEPFESAVQELYRRLSLNHAIALFVPSTMDITETTDNAAQIEATMAFMGGLFGGATRSDAEGVWQSEESGLVTEQVTIVRTFVSQKALNSHLDEVVDFAVQLKQEMKQEAIALDIDNQLVLV